MIEYFMALCLLALLATQGMLVRGCFKLPLELHTHTDDLRATIGTDFDVLRQSVDAGVTLMDELAQLLADSIPSPSAAPVMDNPLMAILGSFMGGTGMNRVDGPTTQEWTIHEESNNPPTLETENELD